MEDVNISKYRAQVVRAGSTPASPGFVVSEGQNPVDPSGSGQNHLPVTITPEATGLSITESQVLGGAGTVGQYIRGDGSLADFPESSGGGSSVSYYLNGSVAQGTIGGVAYKELNKVPVLGAGTDFTINADGYIASFITDAGDPNLLEIAGGNWNFETYFSASSNGGSPSFYVELYKVNSGGTATLIASNSTFPELIAFGTNVISYFSTLAVPTTALALTDRLAIRYYVTHSGRTITLHTEDNHLCQIITTFTTGLTALNGLTAQIQNFAVGTSGTDFAIASATATHTFNLPTASATNRGALSSADWTTFNGKQNALTNPVTGTGTSGTLPKFTGSTTIGNSLFTDNGTNGAFGGANYYSGTDLRSFNISATLYPGIGFFANNVLTGNIFSYSVTGNLILNADPSNVFGDTRIILATDNVDRFAIFNDGNVTIANSPINESFKLYVSGTGKFSSNLTANSFIKIGGTSSQFLKADGSVDSTTYVPTSRTITINGTTQDLSADRTYNVGTVTSVTATAGTGISISGSPITSSGTLTITNTAPDQVVSLTASTGISISGTYPNFTITNTSPASASGITGSGTSGRIAIFTGTNTISSSNINGASSTIYNENPTAGQFAWGFNGSTTTGQSYGANVVAGTNSSDVSFKVMNSAASINYLVVRGDGNVGIGTASPAGKLEINGLTFINNTGDSTSRLLLRNSTTGANAGGLDIREIGVDASINNASNGYLSISTNNTERMKITLGGNVEIYSGGESRVYRSDNARYGTFYCNNSAAIVEASTDPLRLSGPDRIEFYPGSSEKMRITSGGDMFIGCTSDPNGSTNGIGLYPNGEIDISRSGGTTCVFNRNTSNGQIIDFRYNNTQVGSISTNSNSLPSDFNFKKDIIDISIGLNLVSKLRPVHYRHKMDEDNEALSNGIIAQELEQALLDCGIEKNSLLMLQHKPNQKEGESQYWVDYTKMIPVLIKSIQELKQEIDTLKN